MRLSSLLAPMSFESFLSEHWGRRAVYLSGRADRFAALPFDFEAMRQAHRGRESAPMLRAQFFDAKKRHREMDIRPEQIQHCFDAGMTICFGVLPALTGHARAIARSIGFQGNMSFGCYWSPAGAGFGLHYDDREVFVCQLKGSKRWWYSPLPATPSPLENLVYEPEATRALRAKGVPIEEPREEEFAEALLEPGDLLYLPAGAWHRTAATLHESMALTLRAEAGSPADVVERRLRTWLRRGADWRQTLPIAEQADEQAQFPCDAREVLSRRLEELRAFVGGLTVDDLARAGT